MYAKLLLHMLKKGVVEGPFTDKPERGPLPTLPTYMVSIKSGLFIIIDLCVFYISLSIFVFAKCLAKFFFKMKK